jgi:hypothetical protein
MGLIDTYMREIIYGATGISRDNIFNIYQLKGALPEKLVEDTKGKKKLVPYTQQDTFIIFGVEEADNGKESVVITEEMGAPKDTIVVVNKFNVKVLFRGKDADFFAIKFKGRLYSKSVTNYLEYYNITVLTQNPKISFETEEVAGEFWDGRGIQFEALVELHFSDKDAELPIDSISSLNYTKI